MNQDSTIVLFSHFHCDTLYLFLPLCHPLMSANIVLHPCESAQTFESINSLTNLARRSEHVDALLSPLTTWQYPHLPTPQRYYTVAAWICESASDNRLLPVRILLGDISTSNPPPKPQCRTSNTLSVSHNFSFSKSTQHIIINNCFRKRET